MSPPIYTPDGSEVSEIVLPDGSTASEVIGPDGNVVFEAGSDIPDSENLHESYISADQPEADEEVVDPFVGQQNGYDAAATGDPTMKIDNFNNNPAAFLDGADDHWVTPSGFGSLSQPFTVYAVVDFSSGASLSDTRYTIIDQSSNTTSGNRTIMRWDEGNWAMWSGNNFVSGSTDDTQNLITGLFDGANSAIYENESQTGTGDAGSNGIEEPAIGYNDGASSGSLWYGDYVELHIYDAGHDSQTRSDVWSWIKNRTF